MFMCMPDFVFVQIFLKLRVCQHSLGNLCGYIQSKKLGVFELCGFLYVHTGIFRK